MTRPYKTYNGGKNGSGVYQAIINQLPPHDIFISAFAGNCGVMANKKKAMLANIALDVDAAVINAWNLIPGTLAINTDSVRWIDDFLSVRYHTNVLVFADPPYLMSERKGQRNLYKYEMADPASHEKMMQYFKQWKCNICLIHYPCSFYDQLLPDWRKVDIQGRTRKGMRVERLYMNYPEPEALHDYTHIGKDFREREQYKKIKTNMIQKFSRMSIKDRNFIISALKENNLL